MTCKWTENCICSQGLIHICPHRAADLIKNKHAFVGYHSRRHERMEEMMVAALSVFIVYNFLWYSVSYTFYKFTFKCLIQSLEHWIVTCLIDTYRNRLVHPDNTDKDITTKHFELPSFIIFIYLYCSFQSQAYFF